MYVLLNKKIDDAGVDFGNCSTTSNEFVTKPKVLDRKIKNAVTRFILLQHSFYSSKIYVRKSDSFFNFLLRPAEETSNE